MTFSTTVAFSDWLRDVSECQPEAASLLGASSEEQQRRGYFHTLHEILQQPASWIHTAEQMSRMGAELHRCLDGIRSLILTGSGSSEYAGQCVLLTHGTGALPPERPGLVVSMARSGDSPESVGALSLLLEIEPRLRHLVLTCNAAGKLATSFRGRAEIQVVALDDETNDRSL